MFKGEDDGHARRRSDKHPANWPMIIVRLCKIVLVASIALFFTFIAFGNISDFDSNWQFVQHVLSMDTTSPDSSYTGVQSSIPTSSGRPIG